MMRSTVAALLRRRRTTVAALLRRRTTVAALLRRRTAIATLLRRRRAIAALGTTVAALLRRRAAIAALRRPIGRLAAVGSTTRVGGWLLVGRSVIDVGSASGLLFRFIGLVGARLLIGKDDVAVLVGKLGVDVLHHGDER